MSVQRDPDGEPTGGGGIRFRFDVRFEPKLRLLDYGGRFVLSRVELSNGLKATYGVAGPVPYGTLVTRSDALTRAAEVPTRWSSLTTRPLGPHRPLDVEGLQPNPPSTNARGWSDDTFFSFRTAEGVTIADAEMLSGEGTVTVEGYVEFTIADGTLYRDVPLPPEVGRTLWQVLGEVPDPWDRNQAERNGRTRPVAFEPTLPAEVGRFEVVATRAGWHDPHDDLLAPDPWRPGAVVAFDLQWRLPDDSDVVVEARKRLYGLQLVDEGGTTWLGGPGDIDDREDRFRMIDEAEARENARTDPPGREMTTVTTTARFVPPVAFHPDDRVVPDVPPARWPCA